VYYRLFLYGLQGVNFSLVSDKVKLSDIKNGKAFAGERAVFGGGNDQFNGAVAFLSFPSTELFNGF
jgi:hypothetical protein